jgi:hypothetical protein
LIVITAGLILLGLVLEMVRRRRLREEYSWLWLLTAMGFLAVALWPRLGEGVTRFFGASDPISTFSFLGLFFLFLISIQFSIQISRLTSQNKDLAQQIAILDTELHLLHAAQDEHDQPGRPGVPSVRELPDTPAGNSSRRGSAPASGLPLEAN